jgi:hypothetical protein
VKNSKVLADAQRAREKAERTCAQSLAILEASLNIQHKLKVALHRLEKNRARKNRASAAQRFSEGDR